MTTKIIPISTTDLNLGDESAHPRRILPLPNPCSLAAYGGDDGTITVLSAQENKKEENNSENKKWRIGRQFDDAVRSVAISSDGKCIAVGFDEGFTSIFKYEQKSGENSNLHPFFKSNNTESLDGGDNLYEDLLTQSDINDTLTDPLNSSSSSENYFPGPRFAAPIRDLQFHPTQKDHLVVASESSPGFCIVNVSSEESLQNSSRLLESDAGTHHNGAGVRSVAFQPTSGNLLSTLGMDGYMCLWSTAKSDTPDVDWELLHKDKLCCIPKKDVGELMGADSMDRSCRPVWSNEGDYLALPGMADVQLRNEQDWRKQLFILSAGENGHKDCIIAMTWGKIADKRVLITTGRDKRIILWQIFADNERKDLEKPGMFLHELKFDSTPSSSLPSFPTDVYLSNVMKKLFVTMENSTVTVFSTDDISLQPLSLDEAADEESEVEFNSELNTQPLSQPASANLSSSNDISKNKMKRLSKSSTETSNEFNSDDDDDNDDIFIEQSEAQTSAPSSASKFISDEADEGTKSGEDEDKGYDDVIVKGPGKELDFTEDNVSVHDFDVEEDGSQKDDNYFPSNPLPVFTSPEPQAPFSPSATPLHEDISRRILCWNHIGTVTHRRETHSENVVDISFVDSAVRRPVTFPETYGFITGSLGEDGGIFATDVEGDDELDYDDELNKLEVSDTLKKMIRKKEKIGSRIFFHRFDTFGSLKEKDWSLALPAGERVLGCASGSGWASVITSKRFLRLFSSSGVQSSIIWLPGNPVTIIGRERFLAVIYHKSSPLMDSTQQLGYMLLDPVNGSTVASGPMSALSPGATLTWAGFSEDLCAYVMDSKGMLSILNSTYGWQWSPILDTTNKKKSNDDHFWPVTITDGKLVCIPLKGGNEYPDAARRPVTTSIGLKVPLVKGILGMNSFVMEETSVRAAIALKQKEILKDIEVLENPKDEETLEDEYDRYCTTVDKVTLKLFFEAAKRGKVELALDLVDRLHKEKSFDVALRASDQCNRMKLSDEIVLAKERKFPIIDSDDNSEDEHDFEEDDFQNDLESQSITESRYVSPIDKQKKFDKRVRETEPHSDDEPNSPPPKKVLMVSKKRKNPFAKKKIESPVRPTPTRTKTKVGEKSQMSLSRLSTFSAQARQETKKRKNIV